jgi:hypothetical protein
LFARTCQTDEWAPGHTAGADAGSEFLIFSPTEVLAEVEAHMMRRMQEGAATG